MNGFVFTPDAGTFGCIASSTQVCGSLVSIPQQADGLPQMIPVSTAPAPVPVQVTALPTSTNVQNDPAASTVLTSAGGTLGILANDVLGIVTNPTQHILGVIVLLAIAWFIWKHR